MFTGIVTHIGEVRSVETRGDTRLVIGAGFETSDVALGASIACSGACLTVIETGDDWFAIDASAETLARTTLGDWSKGTAINLERALKLGDELGGHVVSGHVDGLARVVTIEPVGDSHKLVLEAPGDLAGMVAEKGSVTLEGVSLTVNEVIGRNFSINIIPHTWENTTLGTLSPGDKLNMEVDMLARYVSRLMEYRQMETR